MEAAAAMVLKRGYLPVSLDDLSKAVGVSKALIYAYFPTQHDLFNAVLARGFEALAARGIGALSAGAELETAALETALCYFDHVAERGPLMHIILRDRFMAGAVDSANRRARDRIIRPLARTVRRRLGWPAREVIAIINMVITIPEESGRLAHAGEMDRDRARELTASLVSSSLKAFSS